MKKVIKKRAPKTPKTGIGILVLYCGHSGCFIADLFAVGNAIVVRAAEKVEPKTLLRGDDLKPTHHLSDWPKTGFWRPDLGVFVVPEEQVKLL